MHIAERLDRWVDAQLIDRVIADRILQFESESGRGLRWPAILGIDFGSLMLCAGVLLFVAAHWDQLSPGRRFFLVLAMVAVFHVLAALLERKVASIGIALHLVGTICLGAGIYMAAQIFNLEEHWPGGLMLWALGAVLAWFILKQWPQALLAALLVPSWLAAEWSLATDGYRYPSWNIAAQGFLLLSIFYLSVAPGEPNRALRLGLVWTGAIALLPFIGVVMFTGWDRPYWRADQSSLPPKLLLLGYLVAYLPTLALAASFRRKQFVTILGSAAWVFWLGLLSRTQNPERHPGTYAWMAIGACALCYWGIRENRRLFINLGSAIFALDVITFYFSSVFDKLGRSMGLILMGVIFVAGGWGLNRVRGSLIARAAAGGNL